MQFTKEEKYCTFFEQYASSDENETSKFPGEGRKNFVVPTLEEFDYDCAIIHVGINDILRSKNMTFRKKLCK